jgi:predicted methyltransferase
VRALLVALVAVPVLVLGACSGLGYTADRPERHAPVAEVEEQNTDLWRAAIRECLASGRTWSQGMDDGVLVGRCSTLPSLGIGPAVARAR